MTFADQLSDSIRRKARRNAILSTLFGCISEQAIDTNTLLILYLIMLGGSNSFSMLSTAIAGVVFTVLSIPAAGLVNRLGLRSSYSVAIYAQTAMFLLIAAAPCAGKFAVLVVLSVFTFFCIHSYNIISTFLFSYHNIPLSKNKKHLTCVRTRITPRCHLTLQVYSLYL